MTTRDRRRLRDASTVEGREHERRHGIAIDSHEADAVLDHRVGQRDGSHIGDRPHHLQEVLWDDARQPHADEVVIVRDHDPNRHR